MLKKRVAAALPLRHGIVVQSIGFEKYLPVGRPEIAAEFLNLWGIDEIFLLDITASGEGRSIDPGVVKRTASRCLVPLAVGGGITKLNEVDALIHSGADKVSLNRVTWEHPEFITDVAARYGDQCVVAAADVIQTDSGYFLFDHLTKTTTQHSAVEWAHRMADAGAGELLINAVHRDGQYIGFDSTLINEICAQVHIPVIALGGAGEASHFAALFKNTNAEAGCAGNFFHFSEHSVIHTKRQLVDAGFKVRLETHAQYNNTDFSEKDRLSKKSDTVLENMLYTKIEEEVI